MSRPPILGTHDSLLDLYGAIGPANYLELQGMLDSTLEDHARSVLPDAKLRSVGILPDGRHNVGFSLEEPTPVDVAVTLHLGDIDNVEEVIDAYDLIDECDVPEEHLPDELALCTAFFEWVIEVVRIEIDPDEDGNGNVPRRPIPPVFDGGATA